MRSGGEAEIQRADKGAGEKGEVDSGRMDITFLKKGDGFVNLPGTWAVLIMENDAIGKGMPLHPVEWWFLGGGDRFEDSSHIPYANANGAYRGDTPTGKPMFGFSCTSVVDKYYAPLADKTRFSRKVRRVF